MSFCAATKDWGRSNGSMKGSETVFILCHGPVSICNGYTRFCSFWVSRTSQMRGFSEHITMRSECHRVGGPGPSEDFCRASIQGEAMLRRGRQQDSLIYKAISSRPEGSSPIWQLQFLGTGNNENTRRINEQKFRKLALEIDVGSQSQPWHRDLVRPGFAKSHQTQRPRNPF